jgi:alpha-1,6-mannosyltransferase
MATPPDLYLALGRLWFPEMSVGRPLGGTPQGGTFELTTSSPAERRWLSERSWLSERQGWIGLAGLLLTGLLICLSAAQTNLLLPESARPVPRWLAGPLGGTGLDLGLGGLIVVLTLMFVSYVIAVRAADRLSARAVLISIAALNALVLIAPPLLSTDVFSYVAYGRIGALYGANPYLHGPSTIAFDPLYQFIGAQWVTTPTAYGPIFTGLSYLLSPLDIGASVFAYKAIAAVSSLVIVVVVWKSARLRALHPVKAVALVGLNPVLIVYGVGGGHNDLLMLAILVTGLYVLLQQRERTSGALIVFATAVKLTAGLLLPFALAGGAGRRDHGRGRHGLLVGAGIGAALIAALGFALFGTGPLHLVGTLQSIQNQGGAHSIAGFISTALGFGALSRGAGLVLAGGFVVSVLWLLRRVWIGELDWITGAGWATFALLLTTSLLLPWYAAWLLPLAALSNDRRLWVTAIVMTGLGLTSL